MHMDKWTISIVFQDYIDQPDREPESYKFYMKIVPTPTTDVSQAIRVKENISVLDVYRDPNFQEKNERITYKEQLLTIYQMSEADSTELSSVSKGENLTWNLIMYKCPVQSSTHPR